MITSVRNVLVIIPPTTATPIGRRLSAPAPNPIAIGMIPASATGNGPVNALDLALRQCLSTLYPAIADVRLTDYKVRVIDFKKGTAARVRVLIEWSDHKRSWATVGVSENVIEASWFALVDAMRLELMRLSESDPNIQRAVEDYCWGV
jgi:2-isopropylmalate synthase